MGRKETPHTINQNTYQVTDRH